MLGRLRNYLRMGVVPPCGRHNTHSEIVINTWLGSRESFPSIDRRLDCPPRGRAALARPSGFGASGSPDASVVSSGRLGDTGWPLLHPGDRLSRGNEPHGV